MGIYWYTDNRRLMIDSKNIQLPINFRGSFAENMTPYSSYHDGGRQLLLSDGAVRFLGQYMDLSPLQVAGHPG